MITEQEAQTYSHDLLEKIEAACIGQPLGKVGAVTATMLLSAVVAQCPNREAAMKLLDETHEIMRLELLNSFEGMRERVTTPKEQRRPH